MRLAEDIIGETNERFAPLVGDTLLVVMNTHWEEVPFTLPPDRDRQCWEWVFDIARPPADTEPMPSGMRYPL